MGASLTSPSTTAPSTSVCNHLFATNVDVPPSSLYRPHNTSSKKNQSMFLTGWNFTKKTAATAFPLTLSISDTKRRSDADKTAKIVVGSRVVTSRSCGSNSSLSSYTRDYSDRENGNTDDKSSSESGRDMPYAKLSIQLDSNQNYKKYQPPNSSRSLAMVSGRRNGRLREHFRNSLSVDEPNTTIISNVYSIQDELRRDLRFSRQVCFFLRNSTLPESNLAVAMSLNLPNLTVDLCVQL